MVTFRIANHSITLDQSWLLIQACSHSSSLQSICNSQEARPKDIGHWWSQLFDCVYSIRKTTQIWIISMVLCLKSVFKSSNIFFLLFINMHCKKKIIIVFDNFTVHFDNSFQFGRETIEYNNNYYLNMKTHYKRHGAFGTCKWFINQPWLQPSSVIICAIKKPPRAMCP